MFTLLTAVENFLTDESGAALAEYVLLVALIAVVAIVSVATFGSRVSTVYKNIDAKMDL